jgi:hypothetical protein
MSGNPFKRPHFSSPVPDINMGSSNGPSAHQFYGFQNERSSSLLDLIAPRQSPEQDQAQHLELTEQLFWAGTEDLQKLNPTITKAQLDTAFAPLLDHIKRQRQRIFVRVRCGPAFLRKLDTQGAVAASGLFPPEAVDSIVEQCMVHEQERYQRAHKEKKKPWQQQLKNDHKGGKGGKGKGAKQADNSA